MLLELAVTVASVVPVLFVGKILAVQVTDSSIIAIGMQALVGAVIGGAIVAVVTVLSPIVVIGTTLAPLIINGVAYINLLRQRRKALNGDYGKHTKWARELVNDGDTEFAFAMTALPQSELMEVKIIADSKEELRELTIERMEEYQQ